MPVTRLQLKQDVLRVLLQEDEALSHMPVPLTTTADSAVGTIIDTVLSRGTVAANRYDGRYVEAVEQVNSPDTGATHGQIARVNRGGFADSTSTLTFSPDMDNAPNSGMDYLMYSRGLSPDELHELITETLREFEAPYWFIPSLLTDSHLPSTAVSGGSWIDVGTPSTTTELVTALANVLLGERSLHAIADAATEGFASLSVDVTEEERLSVIAFVQVNVGTCRVQLWNVTAGTQIAAVDVTQRAWTRVHISEAVPASCEQVQVRFLSTAASDDFYVSAEIGLQASHAMALAAPSWLTRQDQIVDAVSLPRGVPSAATDSFIALSERRQGVKPPRLLRVDSFLHPVRLMFASGGRPQALVCKRRFDDFVGTTAALLDADSIGADRDYLTARVLQKLYRDRSDPKWTFWRDQAQERARGLEYGRRRVRVNEMEEVLV